MFTVRWLCLCLSVGVTSLLSGCARVWLEDPGNLLGQAELVNPIPTQISTTDLFPLLDAKGRFLVIEGDNDGLKFPWTLKSSNDGWVYSYQGLQKVWFIQDENGALYITREDDFEEEVRVVYEPAILALPAMLNSQTAHEQKVEMTVTSLNGKEVRSRGPCYNSITLLGRQTISTRPVSLKRWWSAVNAGFNYPSPRWRSIFSVLMFRDVVRWPNASVSRSRP
ncbi:MAG: hypothetical protein HC898_07690 [Phycisphaerales bacterium]|nr:hypothetical protein [Phycisphaerales bacterium]